MSREPEPDLVLVCGSRTWSDGAVIRRRLEQLPRGAVVMHGGARGADRIAGQLAETLGFEVREMRARWSEHGRAAGVIRNLRMLDESPQLVIAFWRDGSKGTEHVLREAWKRGIACEVVYA